MTLTRRRFLTLSACACAHPAFATERHWSGRAFGADVSIALTGRVDRLGADLAAVVAEIAGLEARFSLFSPMSELQQLNARGQGAISIEMEEILRISRRVHRATEGLFDPTIQVLWQALALGAEAGTARDLVDFSQVEIGLGRARLGPGQKLSLNGIAQGYATDRIAALLSRRGYDQALINIGEYAALGGPYTLGLSDPSAGRIGQVSLRGAALATSSPEGMRIGGAPHILHPKGGRPLWSTVTVEAASAALADACSTAMCLMDREQIETVQEVLGLRRVILVDEAGDLTTI
ncbi:FAD:protein FMN transferase [Celeribacter neptunius]|uniref:FAD:protein FMN transferase n=1 Tax=Celeribacter neptunius TaxID=588602 RepID=A0A1I3UGF2_9RHOB|nr:FAD:protein FMN transferase [Celeribacter neptunius]SFJ81783.1 thiamine biosynthesis lipoprotein [Celeribacter neptunius]